MQPQTLAGLLKKLDLSEYEPKFVAAGITDVLSTKESAVRLAVDAALTVLRVDQIIMSKKAGAGKK